MARKRKTKPDRKVFSRRKVIAEPVFGQLKTLQDKHLLLRGGGEYRAGFEAAGRGQ